jgi:exoribonuclease II
MHSLQENQRTYLNGIVHSHRKTEKVFWQLEMFNVCTTGDTAHIDTIIKFLPHTRQHVCIDILHCCNNPCELRRKTTYWGKKVLSCSFYLYRFRKYVSYGFPIINFRNLGVQYETPCLCLPRKVLFT